MDAFAADGRRHFNYLLPLFNRPGSALDKAKAGIAARILIVPVWNSKPWRRRLQSGAWALRATLIAKLPLESLVAHGVNSN